MITYNPFDIFIVQRNATSTSFQEVVLTSQTSSLIGFDSASNVVSIPSVSGSYPITSSWTNNVLILSGSATSSFQIWDSGFNRYVGVTVISGTLTIY